MNEKSDLSPKIRVAFLGGGYLSAVGRTHLAAISLDGKFELVSGCFSRDIEINTATARHYRIPTERLYSDLKSMLDGEKGKIDALILLTPSDQHFSQIQCCFDYGVPVICEKSFVTSSEEAKFVYDRALKQNHFLAVTFNYTGYPLVRELRNLIRNKVLGDIYQIHIEMPQDSYQRVDDKGSPFLPQSWRQRDYSLPTVSLDLGVHVHSLLKFLLNNEPQCVVGMYGFYGNIPGVVDTVQCLANFEDGGSASIWYGKAALGYRNGLKVRIFGNRGSAEWVQEQPELLVITNSSGNKSFIDRASNELKIANEFRYARFKAGHPAGFIEAFANYYSDVADSLQAHLSSNKAFSNTYVFSAKMAYEGLKFLDALDQSVREKCWINLNKSEE